MTYIDDIDEMIKELEDTKNGIKRIVNRTDAMILSCINAGIPEVQVCRVFEIILGEIDP